MVLTFLLQHGINLVLTWIYISSLLFGIFKNVFWCSSFIFLPLFDKYPSLIYLMWPVHFVVCSISVFPFSYLLPVAVAVLIGSHRLQQDVIGSDNTTSTTDRLKIQLYPFTNNSTKLLCVAAAWCFWWFTIHMIMQVIKLFTLFAFLTYR